MKSCLWVFLASLLCAAPGDPAEKPADKTKPAAADEVGKERTKNDEAYRDYLKQKDALLKDHAGQWIGIAAGKLLPVDDSGKLKPAKEAAECLASLDRAAPGAKHRYLFRIGDEGDVEYDMGGAFMAEPLGNLLGYGLPERCGVKMTYDTGNWTITWRLKTNLKEHVFAGEHFRTDFELASPGKAKRLKAKVGHSTACSAFLLLNALTAESLDLARFEIPGMAKVERAAGDPVQARRAYAVMLVPELEIDELVPIGMFVDSK